MRKLKEIVRDYLAPRLLRHLSDDWSITKICDDARSSIWESCLLEGLDKSLSQQTAETIKQVNLMPQEEAFGEITVRERLSCDEPVVDDYHRRSRGDNHQASETSREAGRMLGQVPWVIDEEIVEIQYDISDDMTKEESEKVLPSRCLIEISNVGSDEWYVAHNSCDTADRMYADSRGTFHTMWDKWSRGRNVQPEWRKTDLATHEAYIEREHGLNSSMVADILKDPKHAYQNGVSMMAIVQSISWYRIASTGKTNIPVFMDAVASGYAHQLADLRDPELFIRALPFRDDFMHPHRTLSLGIRQATNALKSLSISQVVPLGKFVFTPCMYGAGQTGLFSSATSKEIPEELCDGDDWAEVGLPPLINSIIGHLDNEEQAQLLYGMCKNWASIFRRKMPKVGAYLDYWMTRYQEEAGPTGLWLPRADGSPILCPRLRRNKGETIEYRARWWEGKEQVDDTVSLFAPRFDDKGTACAAFVCQNRDAYTAGRGVIASQGKVLASIHDCFVFMLADEYFVQRNYTRAFNEAHVSDLLNTGREQLVVNEDERMLR
jgi:hypothetical protein